MYFIEDKIVYKLENINTGTQIAKIQTYYGYEKHIDIDIDKTLINTNETANIVLKWQNFDLAAEKYIDDVNNNEMIVLSINGTDYELMPEAGIAQAVFQSEITGSFNLNVKNKAINFKPLEVIVDG